MPPMNEPRLRELAQLLREEVPADEFNLNFWRLDARDGRCKTTACACGWAAILRPEWGMRLLANAGKFCGEDVLVVDIEDVLVADVEDDEDADDEVLYGLDAVQRAFSIHNEVAAWLFLASRYPRDAQGPRDVANRIDTVINCGGLPAYA